MCAYNLIMTPHSASPNPIIWIILRIAWWFVTNPLVAMHAARFADRCEAFQVRNRPEVNHTKGSVYVLSLGSRKSHKEELCFDATRLYKPVWVIYAFFCFFLVRLALSFAVQDWCSSWQKLNTGRACRHPASSSAMQRKGHGQIYSNVNKTSGQSILGTVQFKAQNLRNQTLSRTQSRGPKSPANTILRTKQSKPHNSTDQVIQATQFYGPGSPSHTILPTKQSKPHNSTDQAVQVTQFC